MIDETPTLIRSLQNPACYTHRVEKIQLLETHISWIVLTGPFAYKIKKPLDLRFLDFSTLEKRRRFCQEEIRLNRRLAPELYLDVVRITGSPDTPAVNGAGEVLEYAVMMRQFPLEAQLDRVLARGELTWRHIDDIAGQLAHFHGRISVAGPDILYGSPELVYTPIAQNFSQIRRLIDRADLPQVGRLAVWSEHSFARMRPLFAARKRDGFVRECHGDVHLQNMALIDDKVVIFDCIEFNENLRWIDVMSEIAFLAMDLDDRGVRTFARRCINHYLEITGDYAGLEVLRFYQVYRALVRIKVAVIRLSQGHLTAAAEAEARTTYRGYLDLAEHYTRDVATPIIITHGLSGSGKTTISQHLLEMFDLIRVRSDIERKRLHGLAPLARSGSRVGGDLYATEASRMTYERLAALARHAIRGGFAVIVDAAFLARHQRDRFRTLARDLGVPFVILDVTASEAVLRERVRVRQERARDASEAGIAVLEHQLAHHEPLGQDELPSVLAVSGAALPEISSDFLARFHRRLTGG